MLRWFLLQAWNDWISIWSFDGLLQDWRDCFVAHLVDSQMGHLATVRSRTKAWVSLEHALGLRGWLLRTLLRRAVLLQGRQPVTWFWLHELVALSVMFCFYLIVCLNVFWNDVNFYGWFCSNSMLITLLLRWCWLRILKQITKAVWVIRVIHVVFCWD